MKLRSECTCICHRAKGVKHISMCCKYESPEVVNDKHFQWQLDRIKEWVG